MQRLKPDATKQLDKERPALQKEVFDKKLQQEIPKCFKELRDEAKPRIILRKFTTEEDLVRTTKELLEDKTLAPGAAKPKAN